MDRRTPDRSRQEPTENHLPLWVLHDALRGLADIDAGRVMDADQALQQMQERRNALRAGSQPTDPQRDA
jgi:hypothetical protein